ncbi:sugar transferase [Streptomyces sp. enrichment culture]|uniref:sugar transferase n=1 Tax=Streptomyces sp. enrichment culture TaxID=1795815 RepID=UPI003F5768DB
MSTVDRTPEHALGTLGAVPIAPARRVLDVTVALVLLIALAPVLALLGAVVAVTSGRPVLFRQRRVGEGGGEFVLYKFRSMRTDCAGPGVTGGDDARVTRTGRLLRRLSLDELPQLWNVLRGDMTLVGPRPEVPHLAERYPPEHRWVFRHRPGLTGPCQLRSREYAAALDGRPDPEQYYLTVLVPRRVALDAEFLAHATAASVVRFTARTLWYVLSALWDRGGRS